MESGDPHEFQDSLGDRTRIHSCASHGKNGIRFVYHPRLDGGAELKEVYLLQEALGQHSAQTVNGKFCYLPSNIQCELVVKRRR